MALSITSVTQPTGCTHRLVTVDHEGTARTFTTTFEELDTLIGQYGSPVEAGKALVMLWAAYQRSQGRAVIGVTIA